MNVQFDKNGNVIAKTYEGTNYAVDFSAASTRYIDNVPHGFKDNNNAAKIYENYIYAKEFNEY